MKQIRNKNTNENNENLLSFNIIDKRKQLNNLGVLFKNIETMETCERQ